MRKILILGATGMAGHMIYQYLLNKNEYDISTACFRKKMEENSYILDVRNENEVTKLILRINPDYVINCVGVLIKGSKQSIGNAIYVNAYLPHMLETILRDTTCKLIHISTDCVFSGTKGMYTDLDEKDALETYGMTKNLGEILNKKDVTIRTSIIGPEIKSNGEGLFHWLFSQRENDYIQGYDKSVWSGITTLELAKAIYRILNSTTTGLVQLSNNKPITKYDLLCLIRDTFNLNVKIDKVDGPAIDKSIIASKLSNLHYTVPEYDEMLYELHSFMKNNREIYKQYLG